MCGHVGIAYGNAIGLQGGKFFSQALYVDQLRGLDATGVAVVDKDNNVKVYKRALAASDFLQTRMGIRAIDAAEKSFIAIGHNRASTIGTSIDVNSHPFHFENIVGAHNGTIAGHRAIFPVDEYPVDSMNLLASIDQEGMVKILKKIHTGSYAVVLYDKKEECMKFARNSDRPLHILHNDKGILWASEASMLYWIAGRNNMLDKDTVEVQVPENTVITFDCNELTFKKKEEYTPQKSWSGSSSSSWYYGKNASGEKNKKEKKKMVEGVEFDNWLTKHETEKAMAISAEGVEIMPHTFEEFKGAKDRGKGRLYAYVHILEDAALYPAVIYNMKKEVHDRCMSEGVVLKGNIMGAHVSKDGNLISFTVIEADVDDSIDLWEAPYVDTMGDTWKAGRTFCTSLGQWVELHDSGIRKAHILKSTNRDITDHTMSTISLKQEYDLKKVVEEEEEQDNKVLSFPKREEQYTNPEGLVRGPDGPLTPKQFSVYTNRGCCICHDPIDVEDAPDISWLRGIQWAPLCESCSKEDISKLENLGVDTGTIVVGHI